MVETILDADFSFLDYATTPLPNKAGVGLKSQHVQSILEDPQALGFFEIHAENYMGAGGLPHAQLQAIREQFPLSLHGVGMSIGGEKPLNANHLARFKALNNIYQPGMVSEHLAWSTHDDVFFNDLLPVPYTSLTLARVVEHVDHMQSFLGRQILIENPSTYVTFEESTISEVEFMAQIAKRSGCGLLFDVNNVFVSAINHNYSPIEYIDAYPLHLVQQVHLAGHATDTDDDDQPLLIDAHDREICGDVWSLFRHVLSKTGPLPSLVEWDNDVPKWSTLAAEAKRADAIINEIQKQSRAA